MRFFKYSINQLLRILFIPIMLIVFYMSGQPNTNMLTISIHFSLLIAVIIIATYLFLYFTSSYPTNNFHKRLAMGLASIAFIYIIKFLWYRFTGTKISYINDYIYTKLIIDIYQTCIIIWVCLKNNQKVNQKLSSLILFSISALIILSTCLCALLSDEGLINNNIMEIYCTARIVNIIINAFSIIVLYKNKPLIHIEQYYDLLLYMLISITRLIIMTILCNLHTDTFYYSLLILNIMRYYFIYKIVIHDTIIRPSRIAYLKALENKSKLETELESVKETKSKLEDEFRAYIEIINTMPEGVAVYKNNKLIFANQIILSYMGINSLSDIKGVSKDYFLSKEDSARVNEIKRKSKGKSFIIEYNVRYQNRYAKINALMSTIVQNEDIFDIVITRDLNKFTELDIKNELLKKKEIEDELKNELLLNISHEFKTPVNVISSCVQMQSMLLDNEKYGEIDKYNQYIINNCNRLIKLTNNFIDSIKYESNGIKDEKIYLNIVPIIEKLTLSVIPFASQNGISITFDTDNEEVYCNVNIDLLDRVILNLLSNAVKYNKENGEIYVDIRTDKNIAKIIVRDTGIGIPANKIELLFSRFERMDSTLSRSKEGTGLGLSIVKNIVSYFEGTITVESKENQGSSFIIALPCRESSNNSIFENEDEDMNKLDANSLENKINIEFSDVY